MRRSPKKEEEGVKSTFGSFSLLIISSYFLDGFFLRTFAISDSIQLGLQCCNRNLALPFKNDAEFISQGNGSPLILNCLLKSTMQNTLDEKSKKSYLFY